MCRCMHDRNALIKALPRYNVYKLIIYYYYYIYYIIK